MPAFDNIIFTRTWEDDCFFEAHIQFSTNTISVSCDQYLTDQMVNDLAERIHDFVIDKRNELMWKVRKYEDADTPMLAIRLSERDKRGHIVLQVDLKNDEGVTASFGINTELGLLQSFANSLHRLKNASVGQSISLIESES